jgi:hypothetical protein
VTGARETPHAIPEKNEGLKGNYTLKSDLSNAKTTIADFAGNSYHLLIVGKNNNPEISSKVSPVWIFRGKTIRGSEAHARDGLGA